MFGHVTKKNSNKAWFTFGHKFCGYNWNACPHSAFLEVKVSIHTGPVTKLTQTQNHFCWWPNVFCGLQTHELTQKIILWLECFVLCQNTARKFGAGGDFHPFRSYLNSVTMPTNRQCDYVHTIICSQETITKSGIKCCITLLAKGGGRAGPWVSVSFAVPVCKLWNTYEFGIMKY